MLFCKRLCVFKQVAFDEVGRKVTDVVPPDTLADENELFKVRSFGDFFLSKIAEKIVQVFIQRVCKPQTQPAPAAAGQTKAKFVLADFGKAIPSLKQTLVNTARCRFVP